MMRKTNWWSLVYIFN